MYDYSYIIDQMERREDKEKSEWEPAPLHMPYPEEDQRSNRTVEESDSSRGVVIIDFGGDE